METKNFSVMTADQKQAIIDASSVKYESLSKWKESNYKTIAGTYGPDTAKEVLKGVKAAFAAIVDNHANGALSCLSYSDILQHAFSRLSSNDDFAALAAIVKEQYSSADKFVAKCYPYISATGRPLRRVSFLNTNNSDSADGMTIYDAYMPVKLTAVNAVSILVRSFAVFARAANRTLASTAKKITFGKVMEIGQSVGAYSVKVDHDANGLTYLTKGDEIDAPAVPVTGLYILAEYNAELKRMQRE